MARTSLPSSLLLAASLAAVCGCAGAAQPPSSDRGAPKAVDAEPATDDRTGERQRAEAFRQALQRMAGAPGEEFYLLNECWRDAGLETVEIYGSGVGIWSGSRQFEVAPALRDAVLATLLDGDLAAMPATFGGKGTGLEPPPRLLDEMTGSEGGAGEEEGAFAIRVICRIEATVAGRTKSVSQLEKGYQSPELRALAEAIFVLTEKAAAGGVEAASLDDGLAKVADGTLEPETFELMVHRKPLAADEGPGFLLRVRSGRATSRAVDPVSGLGATTELELSADELSEVARQVAAARPSELPLNLYSPVYTDLVVSVLDREASVQAREFAGMSATTHGELQTAFDGLYEKLERLNARVTAEGAAVDGIR